MRFGLDEHAEALKQQARRFLERHATSAEVRRVMERDDGAVAELWGRIVELGWPALLVPERYGGAGLGWVELAAVLEEAGGALLCAPLFSTVCLGTNLLLLGGSEAQRDALLPEIAAGRLRATVAWAEAPEARATVAHADGDEVVLRGDKSVVVDGHTAELLLVSAREPAGVGLYAVPASAPGLVRRARATLDPTRKLADVVLRDVRVPATARLPGDGAALLERALDRAKVALAAEQLGGAERCLAMSVEYAQTRVQFGRPIGSFQAVKHRCADMLMRVESVRSACYWAAFLASSDDAELPLAASLTRSYASEAYLMVAGETIQIHGGMGFTWEHDAHLHLRRARSSATLLGDPPAERARLARALGLP